MYYCFSRLQLDFFVVANSWLLLMPGLLPVLESPWIFFQFYKALKLLEKRQDPWKSLNLCQKVLESPWIWFLIQCLSKWLSVSHYCYLLIFCKQMVATTMVFMLVLETRTLHVKLRTVNCADVLIKMLVWVNAVLLEYRKCGPWKWFLHQEPCFCCCMTPYILQSLWFGFAG